MRFSFGLILFSCLSFSVARGQALQYSRHLLKDPVADRMQLVAGMEGYHHLISFNRDGRPIADIFNSQLSYTGRKEFNLVTTEKSKISILPFRHFYLLYIYRPGTADHFFFKVTGPGEITDLTARILSHRARSATTVTTAYQVLNREERLCLVTNTYIDSLRSIQCSITRFDEDFKAQQETVLSFPFHPQREKLSQLLLDQHQLLVLKERKLSPLSHLLELSKINLQTKQLIRKEFTSGANPFSVSRLQINTRDSSILISSVLPQTDKKKNIIQVIFLCRLGDTLQELRPPTLLRNELNEDLSLNFLLPNENSHAWIPFRNLETGSGNNNFPGNNSNWYPDLAAYAGMPNFVYPYSLPLTNLRIPDIGNYSPPGKIKFSLLNDSLQISKSLLLKPYKDASLLPGRDLVGFNMEGKPWLLVGQDVLRKQKGLALVHLSRNKEITVTDTRASPQYSYLPELMKVLDGQYILLPFSNKREIGLLKINIKSYLDEVQ